MATTTSTTQPRRSFDPPRGKSLDKASVRNTFLWTNWPNSDTTTTGHLDARHTEQQLLSNLKDGSVYSLTAPRSSTSSYNRDLPRSKDTNNPSPANASLRDMKDSGRGSATLDTAVSRQSCDYSAPDVASTNDSVASQPVNGTTTTTTPTPTASRKLLPNGDYTQQQRPTAERLTLSDPAVHKSADGRLSSSQPDEPSRLSRDTDYSVSVSPAGQRNSSPAIPSSSVDNPDLHDPAAPNSSLRPRNTLLARGGSVNGRTSRDLPDDGVTSQGRRSSFSLVRRSTRTNNSEINQEDAPDGVKQRRVSKRRRRDEDDDDHVIVGTKVDQNHVNWVTAYNMLTGIRFTVSRINAKLDRELTMADFEAKHKFSFDMYVLFKISLVSH